MTNILIVASVILFIAVATLVVSGRFGDIFYTALNHTKATVFVLLCLSVGAYAGLNLHPNASTPSVALPAVAIPALGDLYQTSEEKTLATVRNCQAFVTAQLDQQAASRTLPERSGNSPALLHLASDVLPSTQRDWDRCARAFGTNYWKQDISVKGENGGTALCRAYRQQKEYASGEVESWCNTVFKTDPAQAHAQRTQ